MCSSCSYNYSGTASNIYTVSKDDICYSKCTRSLRIYDRRKLRWIKRETWENSTRISRYIKYENIFSNGKVVDSRRGTEEGCESDWKAESISWYPWGKLKFRLPTLHRYSANGVSLWYARIYAYVLLYIAESNITFSPINFIATNVHD